MPVVDQVESVIVNHLGLDAHELAPEALFRDGLGADSLDAFELLMASEDGFDIEIPDCAPAAHATTGFESAARTDRSSGHDWTSADGTTRRNPVVA